MKIIDSHVHFHAQPSADAWKNMCDTAKKNGIGRMIVSHLFEDDAYPSAEALQHCNEFCFNQVRKSRGLLAGLVYLNPQLSSWEQEMLEGIRNGMSGVKLWISLKDTAGSLKNTSAVLKRCGMLHLPVLIHVFNRTGGNLPGEIDLMEFLHLAEQNRDTVMIAAHSGGNIHASAGLYRMAPDNVFFDISGTNPETGMLEQLLKETGAGRILYGSDAMGRSFHSQLLKVFSCNLTKQEQEWILWKNAAEIYHLPEPEDLPCPAEHMKAPEKDFFIFCGHWPFFHLPENTPESLEALLIKEKVKEAWTVSLDAVFSKELLTANRNFGQACRNLKHIRPLAVCNPLSDRAGTLLEDAVASGLFAGVWFSPYIHAFHPLNGNFADQLELCSRKHIPVFLNFGISEYRFRPDGFAPREAAGNELEQLLAQLPANTYTIQGIPYFPCNPPQNVRLQFWNGREADRHNDPAEYPELPSNAIWVQGSEYPFRPLQS